MTIFRQRIRRSFVSICRVPLHTCLQEYTRLDYELNTFHSISSQPERSLLNQLHVGKCSPSQIRNGKQLHWLFTAKSGKMWSLWKHSAISHCFQNFKNCCGMATFMTLAQLYWVIKVTGVIWLNPICSSGGHSKVRSLATDFLQMDFPSATESAFVLGIFIDVQFFFYCSLKKQSECWMRDIISQSLTTIFKEIQILF